MAIAIGVALPDDVDLDQLNAQVEMFYGDRIVLEFADDAPIGSVGDVPAIEPEPKPTRTRRRTTQ